VVAAVVLFAAAALTVWAFSQQGGPVEGAAASPDDFVASFPDDWNCETTINPEGATALALCPGIGRYFYYFIEEEARGSNLLDDDDEGKGCTVLSGTTVASTALGLNPESPTVEFVSGDADELVESFAGDVETFGAACPN